MIKSSNRKCSVYHERLPDLGESGQVTKVGEYIT